MKRLPFIVATLLALAGCTTTTNEPPERVDGIVPTLLEKPVPDKQLGEDEWKDALHLEGAFVIDDATPASGTYPFEAYLGTYEDLLWTAIRLHNLGENPWSVPDEKHWLPDHVVIRFSQGRVLTPPADEKYLVYFREMGSILHDGYWNGVKWTDQGTFEPNNREEPSMRDGWNGTDVWWEFATSRVSGLPEYDGVTFRSGDVFGLCLVFLRQDGGPPDHDYPQDQWPGEGHNPDQCMDASTWPRFRVE